MLQEDLTGGTVRWKRGSSVAFIALERDIAALAAAICAQPQHLMCGTCLHMFCHLENNTLTYCVICADDVVCFDG